MPVVGALLEVGVSNGRFDRQKPASMKRARGAGRSIVRDGGPRNYQSLWRPSTGAFQPGGPSTPERMPLRPQLSTVAGAGKDA